jgi:hypothetical protein
VVKFVNLLENYKRFVQIDGFEIKQKELGSVTNDAALQLSTFVYDPKAAPKKTAAKPAPAGVARTKAAKPAGEPEAPFNVNEEMGSRFVFASFDGSRVRDPFSNPLTKRPDGKVDPRKGPAVAVAPMKLQPGESEADVCKRVEAQLAQIRQLIDSGSFDKAAPVWADTQRLLSVNFKDATCAKKAAELRQAASRFNATMETTTGEQCATLVQGVLAQMQKAFDAGTYDEVDALFNTVRPVIKKIGESSNESLPDLVKACETLISRAQVRREFAGIALNIQGTFWSGSGSSRRAAVIINGQVLSEGERVKLTPTAAKMGKGSTKTLVEMPLDAEVIVKKIEREKVTFLYRNELIERFQFQDR